MRLRLDRLWAECEVPEDEYKPAYIRPQALSHLSR